MMTDRSILVMVAAIAAILGPVQPAGVGHHAPYGGQNVQSSQRHVQNPDGTYDFAYSTGEGAFQSEKKIGNVVSGQYGRQGPDGTFVNVQYQAPSSGRDAYSGSAGYQGYRSSQKAFPGRGYSTAPFPKPEPVQPKPYSAPSQPKAYSGSTFQQQSQDQYRAKAYVGGSSGPITPAGTSAAGSGRPFAGSLGYSQPGGAVGSFGPGVQGPGGFSYSFTSSHSGAPATGAAYAHKQGAIGAAYKHGGGGAAASVYRGEQVVPNFRLGPDGSYDFDFQTSEQYRAESRGRDGSVRGQFGHASPDGVRRNYAFTAGHGGYQVSGDDLPRQPEVPRQAYGGIDSGFRRHDSYSGYRGYQRYPEDESPKPFSFSYNAGDHGRSEVQDEQGVVRGTYTVNTADGALKEVSYKADDTGFSITDEKTVGGVRVPVPAQASKYSYSAAGGAKAGKSGYAYTGPTGWN